MEEADVRDEEVEVAAMVEDRREVVVAEEHRELIGPEAAVEPRDPDLRQLARRRIEEILPREAEVQHHEASVSGQEGGWKQDGAGDTMMVIRRCRAAQ